MGVFEVLFLRDMPGVLVAERMEDALDADVGWCRESIEGAPSVTSQLHCHSSMWFYSCNIMHPILTLKNSPRAELYGLHGFPCIYLRSLVNQNRKTSSIRSRGSSESPISTLR